MILVFIGLILACGLVMLALWFMAVKVQTPKKTFSQFALELDCEDISFSSQGSQIKGWIVSSTYEKPQPLMILVHGWGSCRERMLRYLEPLHLAGFAVMLFDVRSHGESDNVHAPSVQTFRDDLIAAVDYAKSRMDIDSNRIGVLGHSYGGFGSVLANADELGIKALVIDSMPVQFRTTMGTYLKRYKIPYMPFGNFLDRMMCWGAGISRKLRKEFDTLEALKNRKAPVLLVHSVHDDYVPSTELDYIVERLEINHFYVASAGHRNSQSDPKFWANVLPFLSTHVLLQENQPSETLRLLV